MMMIILCSEECMIYLAKTLSFLILCRRHIQDSIEFMSTVRVLDFFWEISPVMYY